MTISQIAYSLAEYLAQFFPDATFYEDPLQQNMTAPAMFLQTRSATIAKRMGTRFLWTLRLDLVYLLDYNLTDLQRKYQEAAEILDLELELFPYISTSGKSVLVRTYDRNWNIDLDELHYKFELRAWVSKSESYALMQSLKTNLEVIDGEEV